jgi:murein DD-endopeptidase MepM/ murein hydrolase activator NlpD
MKALSHTMPLMTPTRRRALAALVVSLFALIQGAVPAFSASEEEVEQARIEQQAAAKKRAEALADLDSAVAVYEELNAELEELTFRIGRLRSQIAVYGERARSLRDEIRNRAVESYMNGDERDPVARVFSPEQAQQSMLAAEVLALAIETESSSLDALLATAAEMDRLQVELDSDSDRVFQLRIEADAVVVRMNELFEVAAQEFAAADANLDSAEAALAEQRRREEEERRRREAEARSAAFLRSIRPSDGLPLEATPGFICPVAGPTSFTNSWGAPRSGGRRHAGTDLMAAKGTPLVAVADGIVRKTYGSLAGIAIYLYADYGIRFFYAHLDSYAAGLQDGQRVSIGDVIGYVGNTGNARAYHLHFSIRPGNISNVNPYPTVAAACL